MRRQMEHRQEGIFVAEGEKVVRRLLESQFQVVSVVLPEKWLHDLEPLLKNRAETFEVFVAEKKLLESLTGFSMYQGLLAVGNVPKPAFDREAEGNSSRI
jgi:tRNA G18 (ribose-2'-O)-methylase SpoU